MNSKLLALLAVIGTVACDRVPTWSTCSDVYDPTTDRGSSNCTGVNMTIQLVPGSRAHTLNFSGIVDAGASQIPAFSQFSTVTVDDGGTQSAYLWSATKGFYNARFVLNEGWDNLPLNMTVTSYRKVGGTDGGQSVLVQLNECGSTQVTLKGSATVFGTIEMKCPCPQITPDVTDCPLPDGGSP